MVGPLRVEWCVSSGACRVVRFEVVLVELM